MFRGVFGFLKLNSCNSQFTLLENNYLWGGEGKKNNLNCKKYYFLIMRSSHLFDLKLKFELKYFDIKGKT